VKIPQQIPGLSIALSGSVLRLEVTKPERRNALNDEIVAALIDAIEWAAIDESVRVIVLSGEGENFCSGFDIVSRNSGEAPRPRVGSIQRRLPSQAHRLIPLMLRTQTPIVCVARGWTAGIGLALALAADFTVSSDDAKFWAPFTERAFTPDSGVSWMLPKRIGEIRARDMILLGRTVSGAEAAAWGMIHAAFAPTDLDSGAEQLIATLAASPTVAIGLAKSLMNSGRTASLDDHLQAEAFSMEISSRSQDFKEGRAAFQEKRPPEFKGR
jgi:2-(1,2-epoxy-1,2-dihydrophenyl)acetyl-CoA isomerase